MPAKKKSFEDSFRKALHASSYLAFPGVNMERRCESQCPSIPHFQTTPSVGRCEKKTLHQGRHVTKYHGRWLSWTDPKDEGPIL